MLLHLGLYVVTENLDTARCGVVKWWDGAQGRLDARRHPPAYLPGGGRLGARVSTGPAAPVLPQRAGKTGQGNVGESVDAARPRGGGPAEIVGRYNVGGGRRGIRDRTRRGAWTCRRGACDGLPSPVRRIARPTLPGTRSRVCVDRVAGRSAAIDTVDNAMVGRHEPGCRSGDRHRAYR